MIGDPFYLPGNELRRNILYFSCRDTPIDGARLYFCPFQYDRSGGDYRIRPDLGIVHYDRPHSDKHPVVNDTSVDNGIVTYRNIIADTDTRLLISTVNDHPILDIHLVAYANTV